MIDILTALTLAGIGGPTAASAFGIGNGLKKRRDQRQLRERLEAERLRSQLLQGTLLLQPQSFDDLPLPDGIGRIPCAAFGTAGVQILATCLTTVNAASLQKIIGPIFLDEPDDIISLPDCLNRIPPVFHDRLLVPKFDALGGGFRGIEVREVYLEEHLPLWRDDQQPFENRFLSQMVHQPEPPFALWFISPGPSGAMGWPLLQAYAAEHPQTPIYVVFVLDQNPERRKRHVGQLLDLYSQGNLVSLWIINDNQRGDQEEYDNAIAAFWLTTIQGPWLEKTSKAGWNTLGDVHRLYGHRVATLRLANTRLGANYLPRVRNFLPEVWYTNAVSTRIQLRRSVYTVLNDPASQSLPLPAAGEPWLVGITSPIQPSHLLRVKESFASISLDGHKGTLLLSSIGLPLTPTTTDVEAATMAMVPIAGGIEAVRKLAAGEIQPGQEFEPNHSLIPDSFATGGNHNGSSGKTTTSGQKQLIYDED